MRTRPVCLLVALVALLGATAVPGSVTAKQPTRRDVLPPSGRAVIVSRADRPIVSNPDVQSRQLAELRVPDRAALDQAKAAAALSAPSNKPSDASGAGGPAPAAYAGLSQPGVPAGEGSPPDPTGAIGPNDYIEMVNTTIRIYDRNLTTIQASASLGSFIGYPTDDVFDPQIQWDQQAQRFIFVMDDLDAFGNYLAFGWSKTANPANLTTDWCVNFIYTGDFDDYPKLGHNDTHILIGTNVFDGTDSFIGSRLWAVTKPVNGSTECGEVSGGWWGPLQSLDGDYVFTPVPANTFGSSAAGYVVAADFLTGESQISVWHVSGAAGSETLTEDGLVTVPDYSIPANVPQPGTTNVLDTMDGRLTQAVAMPDPDVGGALAVWTQHTIGSPSGRSVVRWYELVVGGGGSPLRQVGEIGNASHFVFNGAISPAATGNDVVINYNVGGASLTAEIRAQSRGGATPLGTMTGEITLGTSVTYDRDFTCQPVCRWGDYAGASPDPVNTALVWGTNQAIGSYPGGGLPHWTTRNFALSNSPVWIGPANDNFASAEVISGLSGSTTGSNINALGETGEPANTTLSEPIHSVWYAWTTPESGTVVVDLCGSDFDTTLGVYTGTSVDALTQVASNDDDQTGNCGADSRVTYSGVEATTYYLSVDGYAALEGAIVLNYSLTSGDTTPPTVEVPERYLYAPSALGTTAPLRLSWEAASDPSGIASYELQLKKGTGLWTNVSLAVPTATSVDVSVTPGKNYTFRLRATDGAGNTGAWATTSTAKLSLRQETSTSVTYTGAFKRVSLSGASGGYVRQTTVAGRIAKLTFSGSCVAFVTTRAPSRGIVEIRLDSGSWIAIDLYSSSTSTKRIVWATEVGPGTHTVQVRVTGTKNPAATSTRVDIDAFLIQP